VIVHPLPEECGDHLQVHGCCSVDQDRPTETKFGLPSVPFLNLLNKIVIQAGNFE